jgi:methionyl-tRNA formyltransferase
MGGMKTAGVVLFSKQDTFSTIAQQLARIAFGDAVRCVSGNVGEALPEGIAECRPEIVLSFLSPWILPRPLLESADIALNWHPASRDYPGIGCYNFALYEDAREYGATCHRMAEKVDTGEIVEEVRFAVAGGESVESLKLRTMVTMTAMFHATVFKLAAGWKPRPSEQSWSRRPFTRRQLNALAVIDAAMPAEEIRRRIRATTYPGYAGPSVTLGGETFLFPVPNRRPLA